jgi:hypothetical protein
MHVTRLGRNVLGTPRTGLLVGVYAGLVLLATHVLGFHSSVAVAMSTLIAAALFAPVRQRVQRVVDRRFNRARYDADQIVTAFAARLKDAVDLGSVRDDLTAAVERALEPAHLSVWISPLDWQSRAVPASGTITKAEGVGFEPTRTRQRPNGFQDHRHRPLGEPSCVANSTRAGPPA